MAALAEANCGDKGLWPAQIAPFDVHVLATGKGVGSLKPRAVCRRAASAAGRTSTVDDRRKVTPA